MNEKTTQALTAKTTEAEQCPGWCSGIHGLPGWCKDENTRYWHMTADCPPWCVGHTAIDPERDCHNSAGSTVILSAAPPVRVVTTGHLDAVEQPASIEVALWEGIEHTRVPGPVVSIQQMVDKICSDGFVPDMTPAEAAQLGVTLIQAAWTAQPGTAARNTSEPGRWTTEVCPSWCGYGGNDCEDCHLSAGQAVPVVPHHGQCAYTRKGPGALGTCPEDACAELVLADDGEPLVSLHHGDDTMPSMRLEDAEVLAQHILGLAAAARAERPAQAAGTALAATA